MIIFYQDIICNYILEKNKELKLSPREKNWRYNYLDFRIVLFVDSNW